MLSYKIKIKNKKTIREKKGGSEEKEKKRGGGGGGGTLTSSRKDWAELHGYIK